MLFNALALAGLIERERRTVLFLPQIGVAHIVDPLLLPGCLRFTYGGAPAPRNQYWRGVFGENTVMMNLLDNRPFHDLVERLVRRQRDAA